MSIVNVDNLFKLRRQYVDTHKIARQEYKEFTMLSNRQFQTYYWHRLNLDRKSKSFGTDESRMISQVSWERSYFEAKLSFNAFDWLLAE